MSHSPENCGILLGNDLHRFGVRVRTVVHEDVSELFGLIRALADYEHLADAVTGSAADLETHLFGKRSYAEAIVAEERGGAEEMGRLIGFALFFHNYSTFLTRPGLYLEDLFVLPDWRGRGIGKALLVNVAQLAVARGCGRLEWSVLDWNEAAIAFYERMGASLMEDWRICRVTGDRLNNVAATSL